MYIIVKQDKPVFSPGVAKSAVSLGKVEKSVKITLKAVESTFCISDPIMRT